MALDFPASPTVGQQFTAAGVTWVWDGTKWAASGLNVAYLPLTGGTMTGDLILNRDPQVSLGAATKQYADSKVSAAPFLPLAGGVLTGALTLAADPVAALGAATKQYADKMLPLVGGTLTGTLVGTTGTFTSVSNSAAGATIVAGHAGSATALNNVAGLGYSTGVGLIVESAAVPVSINRNAGNGIIQAIYQSGTQCGNISVANATSTAYNTSSDVRLKTDAQSFDAGPILDATNVYNFEWTTAPGVRAYGVMAQEANEVFPDAIHHDEESDTWGVDYSKYVPLLLNEVKALRARVAALESSIG
jgi:Chaperone of endosialidase